MFDTRITAATSATVKSLPVTNARDPATTLLFVSHVPHEAHQPH